MHPRAHVAGSPASAPAHSDSARFGRVDDEGRVFVVDGDTEREVGSYPGASADEALQYFARKYDELAGSADLLRARMANPDVGSREIADGLGALRAHLEDANVVGDLAALRAAAEEIESGLAAKREAEAAARAEAKAAALLQRESIVERCERIAAQPAQSTQWKQSAERMRALLEEWKQHQRTGPRLDKADETELWQRFSQARNTFDKARRAWFTTLDESRASAKATKEALIAQAEELATSTDWAATARAFKQLMDQWRRAGRASRGEDDRLWQRFKMAQDAFFSAKNEAFAVEDAHFRANLAVKEELLKEAEALLPVTDLDATKTALRGIQDRWDRAGKVPRGDMDRTEKALRRVESAVREAEERRWKSTNPEVAARANSMVTQLEASLSVLRDDLAKATAKGNAAKAAQLESRIEAQEQWLRSARAGADEFGG